MKRSSYDKLVDLRSRFGDPINQFLNLTNSLASTPAKKVKGKKKKGKKKKHLEKRMQVDIEDISDGNL